MKIGNMEFKEYAAKKPISVSPTGDLLTPEQVLSQPALTLGSLFALEEEMQMKLVLERYEIEPDFKLGIFGTGILTKDEIIEHIEAKDDPITTPAKPPTTPPAMP